MRIVPITLKTAFMEQPLPPNGGPIMDIETRLTQVASVIKQIDDPKVPRNIRRQAKETCELWLLNKSKKLDVRIAMSQSKLEELYEDPNIPPEFGTLILMINTELEKILIEVLWHHSSSTSSTNRSRIPRDSALIFPSLNDSFSSSY